MSVLTSPAMCRFTFYHKPTKKRFTFYEYRGHLFFGRGCHMKWFRAVGLDHPKIEKHPTARQLKVLEL